MAETTIEWTEQTWNPIVGCSVVSPGCTNCYAMKMAARLEAMGTPRYAGLTRPSKAGPVWTGELRLVEDALTIPLRRRKPTTYFVNSMSDLFHESVLDAWIDRVFAVMALCPQHTFQVLTKRSARMRAYLGKPGDERRQRHEAVIACGRALSPNADWSRIAPVGADRRNVWLGISAEDQQRYDERADDILSIGWAGTLFVSAEPLLGPLDLRFSRDHCDLCGGTGILARWPKGVCHECDGRGSVVINGKPRRDGYRRFGWVIAGGESGPNARPMHPDWARSIRDQCAAAGVPFHFKQWGAWRAELDREAEDSDWRADYSNKLSDRNRDIAWLNLEGGRGFHGERFHVMRRVGKQGAGRLLDGVTHDGFPTPSPAHQPLTEGSAR